MHRIIKQTEREEKAKNIITPSFLDDERKMIIKNYSITRKKITEYAPVFPDKVMRNLTETEIIYSVLP